MSETNYPKIHLGSLGKVLLLLAFSQIVTEQNKPDSIWTFSEIRSDLNADNIPDNLSKNVTVTGIANIDSGLLHEQFLQIFIQNDSSGMSLFADNILTPVQAGDSLVVHGYIDQYNGLTEIQVNSYTVHKTSSNRLNPKPLSETFSNPAKYLGMLTEGTGRIIEKGSTFNGKYLRIEEESGKDVMVYVSNFHALYDGFNFDVLNEGDRISVKGVVTEYNPEYPEKRTFKLFLRTPADLEYEGLPKFYLYVLLGILTVGVFFIVGWIFVLRHRVNVKTKEIKDSLTEKETLLKEIHHRVKNSLAIVSGLIELQWDSTDNEVAKNVLQSSKNRIHSIGLIHEKLYQTETLSEIDLGSYIQDLVEAIHGTFSEYQEDVNITFDFDPIEADADLVIPIGLLINELVVNAYKHAFKKGKRGELSVSIKCVDNNICIRVSDNGPGLPDDFSLETDNSLGALLISSFANQLKATMDIDTQKGKGTTFTFTFPNRNT